MPNYDATTSSCTRSWARSNFLASRQHNIASGTRKNRKIVRSQCLDGVATIINIVNWQLQTTLWPDNMVTLSQQNCGVSSSVCITNVAPLVDTRDVNVSFFCDQTVRFLLPLWKKTLFRFVFVWNTKTKKKFLSISISKKIFLKLLINFFSFLVFVWERFVSSKQNLPNTMNLMLSNCLNSMVVRLYISSNFLKTNLYFCFI